MNVICAPSGNVDTERPGQGISDIAKAGFENILLDFTMYCPPAELESAGKSCAQAGHQNRAIIPKQPSAPQSGKPPQCPEGTWLQSLVQAPAQHSGEELPEHPAGKLLRSCKETHLTLPIATAPYLSRDTKQRDGKELLTRLTRESIRICGEAGSRYLIVRPLPAAMPSAEAWETNRDFYLSLGDSARKSGITILLENQCRSLNGHLIRGACAEAEEAASWVDSLNEAAGEERFGFCMNTGTYNLCGQNMREIAVQLGSRVKAVLLRDCDGQRESSLLPFTAVCGPAPDGLAGPDQGAAGKRLRRRAGTGLFGYGSSIFAHTPPAASDAGEVCGRVLQMADWNREYLKEIPLHRAVRRREHVPELHEMLR